MAQIAAWFEVVTVGVCGAAKASIVLVASLPRSGFVNSPIGLVWSGYIAGCAASHILLNQRYRRSGPDHDRWPTWALWFTAISCAEGIGWGWAPIGLASGGRFDVELIVLLVTLAVAAGSMVAFCCYLPALFALFLPATLPYMVSSVARSEPLHRIVSLLMFVFVGAIAALGFKTNRSFKQLVRLRIRTEEMAVDLQRQKEIAERASLAKSTFLAAASHDLRQPVHAPGMFVGALRGVAMAPEGRRIVEQTEASMAAMDGLFAALLDISRLDAGVVAVERRSFAIGLQPEGTSTVFELPSAST